MQGRLLETDIDGIDSLILRTVAVKQVGQSSQIRQHRFGYIRTYGLRFMAFTHIMCFQEATISSRVLGNPVTRPMLCKCNSELGSSDGHPLFC